MKSLNIVKNTKRLAWVVCLLMVASCEDVFDSESTSVVIDNGEQLTSPSDTLYSAMGILSQFHRLGERYVLLGELRGDLMDATAAADKDLQDIAAFDVQPGNAYLDRRDYYAVINNCNRALQRLDTTVVDYQSRFNLPEYAAISALRAWTYWQMALTYGRVTFFTEPLLSLEATQGTFPGLGIDELAIRLTEELEPFADVRPLDYGSVDGIQTSRLFVPVAALLGDLYLYQNRYEEAATQYYNLIRQRQLTISDGYANEWTASTRSDATMRHAATYTDEAQFLMAYSSDPREEHPALVRLAFNAEPSIVPSKTYEESMTQRMYFFTQLGGRTISAYLQGDLRAQALTRGGQSLPAAIGSFRLRDSETLLINKFQQAAVSTSGGRDPENEAVDGLTFTRQIPLLRTPHLFLRFAEAVNRAGKPTMAFAVLKYGLTRETMADTLCVLPRELSGERYTDFTWQNSACGTARRGLGPGIPYDTDNYILPEQPTLADSIQVVEDMIVDELAAETAFEGNRFFDLLRVARHRDAFPSYVAEKVSHRFVDPAVAFARLNDEQAWWLK